MNRKLLFGSSIAILFLLGILASCSQINELPLDTKASNPVVQTGNTGNNSLVEKRETIFYEGRNVEPFTLNCSGIYRKDNLIYYIVEKPFYDRVSFVSRMHGFMFCYDIETENSYPLCSKPDCQHLPLSNDVDWTSEDSCIAHLGIIDSYSASGSPGLIYSDGIYLYACGDDLQTRSVIRYSLDGSIKEKVVDFGKIILAEDDSIFASSNINNFLKIGKNVFFSIDTPVYEIVTDPDNPLDSRVHLKGNKLEISMINLESSEQYLLMEKEAANAGLVGAHWYECGNMAVLNIAKTQHYGSGMFETRSDIYIYDTETSSLKMLMEDVSTEYSGGVADGIYYVDAAAKEIRHYEINTRSVTTIAVLRDSADEMVHYFENCFIGDYAVVRKSSENSSMEIYDLKKQECISEVSLTDIDGNPIFFRLVYVGVDKVIVSTPFYNISDGTDEKKTYYLYCDFEDMIQGGEIDWKAIAA